MLTMRRVVPLICVGLLFGCDDGSKVEPTAPRVSLSVAGSESVVGYVEISYPSNAVETYSFSAVRGADGAATGRWQDKYVRPDGRMDIAQGSVRCFTIQDGNEVWLGGVFERFNGRALRLHREAIWTVVDNGEGRNAPPDEATDLTYMYGTQTLDADAYCASGSGPHWYELAPIGGNIQVKP